MWNWRLRKIPLRNFGKLHASSFENSHSDIAEFFSQEHDFNIYCLYNYEKQNVTGTIIAQTDVETPYTVNLVFFLFYVDIHVLFIMLSAAVPYVLGIYSVQA